LGQEYGKVVTKEIPGDDVSGRVSSREVFRKLQARLTKLWSSKNRGFTVFWILCALTVASAWAGFALEASVKGPVQAPDPPRLIISFSPGSPAPLRLSIDSFLEQASTQPELILTASGVFAQHQKISNWSINVQGFTGYICPHQTAVNAVRLPRGGPHDYYLYGRAALSAISGAPFVTIKLCWNSGAPLVTNGAYVSADLPAVLAPMGQAGTVTRILVLSHPPMSDYTPAGGVLPAVASGQGWFWNSNISDSLESQGRFDIPVIASSLPGLEHANRLALYAGILFGIAGGALVSLLPALHDAVERRNTKQEPGEASEQRSRPRDRPDSAGE